MVPLVANSRISANARHGTLLISQKSRLHNQFISATSMQLASMIRLSELVLHFQEQGKRVLNAQATTTVTTTMTTTTVTSASSSVPAPPPLPHSSKSRSSDDAVEMQSIESFKLKETPSTVPKPPSTYFPMTCPSPNGSPRHAPRTASGKDAATSPVAELAKTSLPSPTKIAQSARPNKVAIKIGAYEGEAKQPSRLEFLPQQTNRDNTVAKEAASDGVVSKLQNELAATLLRSNLRRKTEWVRQRVCDKMEIYEGNET